MNKQCGMQTVLVGPSTELTIETVMSSGLRGQRGLSPYQEWLERGNEGSYEDFLSYIAGAPASISEDPDNRLKRGSDGGLHVSDTLSPDPLMYYLLARG